MDALSFGHLAQEERVAISNQPIRKCRWVVEMRARMPGGREQANESKTQRVETLEMSKV